MPRGRLQLMKTFPGFQQPRFNLSDCGLDTVAPFGILRHPAAKVCKPTNRMFLLCTQTGKLSRCCRFILFVIKNWPVNQRLEKGPALHHLRVVWGHSFWAICLNIYLEVSVPRYQEYLSRLLCYVFAAGKPLFRGVVDRGHMSAQVRPGAFDHTSHTRKPLGKRSSFSLRLIQSPTESPKHLQSDILPFASQTGGALF